MKRLSGIIFFINENGNFIVLFSVQIIENVLELTLKKVLSGVVQ